MSRPIINTIITIDQITMTATVEKKCSLCGKPAISHMTAEQFKRWDSGLSVQNVFADWTADMREQLITGTHGPCFDKMFEEEP